MLKHLLFFIFLQPLSGLAAQLSQNDISILMPLSQSDLFRPNTSGAFGELLPKFVYKKFPTLVFENPEETYKKIRVVGVRIDPCFFPVTSSMVNCQAQIRMVWQPLTINSIGDTIALDAAIHTFYDLPPSEFAQLITELEKIKATYGDDASDEAIGVSPLLRKYGLSSSYAKELFSILLSHTGASRLSQATFMQLSGGENVWIFGGFLISGRQITNLPIPRISGFTQKFQNNPSLFSPTYFANGKMDPAPHGVDTFNLLIGNSMDITKADAPEVIESTMSAFRVENPNSHNTNTMDCVSCHTAQMARVWSVRQFPWLNLEPKGYQFKFQSKFNLSNNSPNQNNTKILRAFGYSGTDPAVSQRTINETAAVLDRLYPVH